MVPDCEGNVAQAQGVVVRGVAIFPGAQQEEEGDPNHFDGGGEFGRGGGEDESRGVVDGLDWEGFNAMWGRIVVGVGGVQPREPGVHEASRREAQVGLTHVGEALCNGEDFVTYVWSPDRLTTAAGGPQSNAVCEDAEVGYFVRHSGLEGVQAQRFHVRHPVLGQKEIEGVGTLRRYGLSGLFCRRSQISCERSSGEVISICQFCA